MAIIEIIWKPHTTIYNVDDDDDNDVDDDDDNEDACRTL